MDSVIIPQSSSENTILILDDEPEHIYWLIDYIEAKGLSVKLTTNAKEAITEVNKSKFRGYIIDLNVPLGGWQPTIPAPNTTYEKYKGLYIAKYVRTQGNVGSRVIAYSAHWNEEIKTETELLYIDYVAKGRAAEFKAAITSMLPQKLAV